MIHFYIHPKYPAHYLVRWSDPHKDRYLVPNRAGGWADRAVWHAWGVSTWPEASIDAEAEAARLGIPWDGTPDPGLRPEIAAIFGKARDE